MNAKDMSDCTCNMHGDMWNRPHWGFMALRIAVAIIIFWCGVQFGEVEALVHEDYGQGMMGDYGQRMYMMAPSVTTMSARAWTAPTQGMAPMMPASTTTGQ